MIDPQGDAPEVLMVVVRLSTSSAASSRAGGREVLCALERQAEPLGLGAHPDHPLGVAEQPAEIERLATEKVVRLVNS